MADEASTVLASSGDSCVSPPAAEHPMAAHRIDSRAIQARGRSDDAREGVGAFLEKRVPHYPNKVSSDMPGFFPWWNEPGFE